MALSLSIEDSLIFQDGVEKGMEKGKTNKARNMVTNMLRNGEPHDKIMRYAEVDQAFIENVAATLKGNGHA